MQIANPFDKNVFPSPSEGNTPDVIQQQRRQRRHYRRIQLMRTVRFWWFRIIIIAIAVYLGVNLGPYALVYPKEIFGAAVILPIIIFLVRKVEVGFLITAIVCMAFFPAVINLKSLAIYPAIPLLFLLFVSLLLQVVFHVRKAFLPSFWVIWPQIGMVVLALVSVIIVQLFWTHGVPHKINSNPIYYDEILGVGIYFFPLIAFIVTTVIVSQKESLIEAIQNTFVVGALFLAVVIFIDFKRIGGDIYTFRFADPHIFWMSLRALVHLLVLGCLITYVRFLYPSAWRGRIPWYTCILLVVFLNVFSIPIIVRGRRRELSLGAGTMRVLYLLVTLICLVAIVITLQNSWWLEVGVGFLVITLVYSRRLLLSYGLLILPFVPLIKAEITKIQSVKTDDLLRLIIWQDALRVWSKQPVLGVGPGDFWAYDQVFTNLPRIVRNCNATGLCVAHNGYLQTLGEIGPLGLFFYLAFIVVLIIASSRLYRRSKAQQKPHATIFGHIFGFIGLRISEDSEKQKDRRLGLISLGLVCGSTVGDFFLGEFFLPPRQVSVFNVIPPLMTSWLIWGLVMYKDQLWRTARKKLRFTPAYINAVDTVAESERSLVPSQLN